MRVKHILFRSKIHCPASIRSGTIWNKIFSGDLGMWLWFWVSLFAYAISICVFFPRISLRFSRPLLHPINIGMVTHSPSSMRNIYLWPAGRRMWNEEHATCSWMRRRKKHFDNFVSWLVDDGTFTCPNEIHPKYKGRAQKNTETRVRICAIFFVFVLLFFVCVALPPSTSFAMEMPSPKIYSRWIQLRLRYIVDIFGFLPEFNSIFYSLPRPDRCKIANEIQNNNNNQSAASLHMPTEQKKKRYTNWARWE